MIVIDAETMNQMIVHGDLVDRMEQAMRDDEEGVCQMPERMHVEWDHKTLLLMPAIIKQYFSTKLVSLFPDNPQQHHPVLYGAVLLNDGLSGEPLALLNGAQLTALRTAAVSAAGIRLTTPPDIQTAGLIGTGVQGFQQIRFACAVRPVKKVNCFDANNERLNQFISALQPHLPGIELHPCKNAEELVINSQLIITATTARSPVLPDDPGLLRNRHYIAIGSYQPGMRELPDAIFKCLDLCIIDTQHAITESGDLIDPVHQELLNLDNIYTAGKILKNPAYLSSKNHTTLFKSVGMALFDLYAAIYFYEKAQSSQHLNPVNF